MRVAIVSDIHGNLTAFEAVLADLRETAPDLVLQGGDLSDAGAHPTEILDQIRDLNWPGVYGNTDEMLFRRESLQEFASNLPQLRDMFDKIEEMAAWTRHQLGPNRLTWLEALPLTHTQPEVTVIHAGPESPWRVPCDNELAALNFPLLVYGHIHRPFIEGRVANSGSVGQPHDGDHRASYLLIDGSRPEIRRVKYNLEREVKALKDSGLPHADWTARILKAARPQNP